MSVGRTTHHLDVFAFVPETGVLQSNDGWKDFLSRAGLRGGREGEERREVDHRWVKDEGGEVVLKREFL